MSMEAAPALDVPALRARTPGTRHARHLNAAGAALPSQAVLDAVIAHLRLEARIGGYEAAEAAQERLDGGYVAAARLLGAGPDDIALVESATVAWQRSVDALRLGPGDRILASRSSYASSALSLLELQRTRGVTVEVLPADDRGAVDLAELAAALRRPAALVTVAQVPTSSGLVEPVADVGAVTRAAGVRFLLDATQSVGQLPVDVAAIGCDLAVATGRKFLRAPRGTGLLYVSPAQRAALPPLNPDVRGAQWTGDRQYQVDAAARRYETWETSPALRLGLGVAVAEALELGVDRVQAHVTRLAGRLRAGLAALPGWQVVDPPAAASAIVTFLRDGEDPRQTVADLRSAGFHLVAVPASHGQWDLGRRGYAAVVRASVHVYNGDDDVDALLERLAGRSPSFPGSPRTDRFNRAGRSGPAVASPGDRADVVVVGAGIHGSATAWQLASRGSRVLHLEQFAAGHEEGSSHGPTRMIRRAYPSGVWDGLVDRAYDAWAELSQAYGQPLVTTVGGLFARPAGAEAGGLRGPGCEVVDAGRAAALFPGLALGEGFSALYDPAAGVVDAAAALRALRQLGRDQGVVRRDRSPVLSWDTDGDGVVVRTPQATVHADRVVFCTGPWTGALVPELADVLQVIRIVNVHVGSSTSGDLAPPALGPFSVDVPEVGLLYGIPAVGGSAVKVGLDGGPDDDPRRPARPVTVAEREALRALAHRFLPAADGPVVAEVACRYTMAPGNRFAVGALPGRPQVYLAAACSGHGFKFGPAIGAALADLVCGKDRPDLAFVSPGDLLSAL